MNIPEKILLIIRETFSSPFSNSYIFRKGNNKITIRSGGHYRDLDLSNLDLSRSDLRNVYLENVSLKNADLSDVNFSGSSLKNVDFTGANLDSANFTHASLQRTVIPRREKNRLKGAQTIRIIK